MSIDRWIDLVEIATRSNPVMNHVTGSRSAFGGKQAHIQNYSEDENLI